MTRSLLLLTAVLAACNAPPSQSEYDQTRGARIDVFFNNPGTRPSNLWEPDAIPVLVDLIDSSRDTLDFAAMGFNRPEVVAAVIRAWDRGVKVRFVGDAGHLGSYGYEQLYNRQIPMVVGNDPHIMHNKFFIVDGRFVWAETANVTNDDLRRNWNNFVSIDSPAVAEDFTTEFEQMWAGRFGATKTEVGNGKVFQVGDTQLEVWFTPDEDALGRLLEIVNDAQEGVRFTIFAFTKDQLGSAYIHKQEEFEQYNAAHGLDMSSDDIDSFHTVAGVIDQSQLHSNGQYHEAYRLLGAAVPMRLDGNDDSAQPGDYQAGGGRLHSKTMVIDANTDDPTVITGSFNWSSSATLSNDEFLLVLKSPRIAAQYKEGYFDQLWFDGRHIGNDIIEPGGLQPGDIVFNEIMWYGLHDGDPEGNDEFIELRNRTDHKVDLSMWQIVNDNDFVVGLPPGSVVGPQATFLILDHTLEPYADGVPQDQHAAYLAGDLVVNAFNDNRQSRLYLKDGSMHLYLQDPRAQVMDVAGDGGPPFAGGPDGTLARSMERREDAPGDGSDPASWYSCTSSGDDPIINPDFANVIVATPDRPNSPPP